MVLLLMLLVFCSVAVAAVAGIAVKVAFEVDAVVGFVPAALMEVGRLAGSGMDYQLDN